MSDLIFNAHVSVLIVFIFWKEILLLHKATLTLVDWGLRLWILADQVLIDQELVGVQAIPLNFRLAFRARSTTLATDLRILAFTEETRARFRLIFRSEFCVAHRWFTPLDCALPTWFSDPTGAFFPDSDIGNDTFVLGQIYVPWWDIASRISWQHPHSLLISRLVLASYDLRYRSTPTSSSSGKLRSANGYEIRRNSICHVFIIHSVITLLQNNSAWFSIPSTMLYISCLGKPRGALSLSLFDPGGAQRLQTLSRWLFAKGCHSRVRRAILNVVINQREWIEVAHTLVGLL